MKKRILCLFVALFTLCFTSCSNLNDQKEDSTDKIAIEKIAENIEKHWADYNWLCVLMDIDTYPDEYWEKRVEIDTVLRCVQSMFSDVNNRLDGIYCYDLYFYTDGTGALHYRHYYSSAYPFYDLDQEECVSLTEAEVLQLRKTINTTDYWNISSWNQEEIEAHLTPLDGEDTYIWGACDQKDPHLISMWGSTPEYGIYQIRTAIEDLVREKIKVTSGRVYVDYEND